MTYNTFIFACKAHTIDPHIALENPLIKKVIKDDKGKSTVSNEILLNTILKTEF